MALFLMKLRTPVSVLRFIDRYRGGRLERVALSVKSLLSDYSDVIVEGAKDMTKHPVRSSFLLAGITGTVYAYKTNPSYQSFQQALLHSSNDLLQLSNTIRNPTSDNHVQSLIGHMNDGTLRYTTLGVVSVVWTGDYDKNCNVYAAECQYLKPQWLSFHERVADVGFCGRWLVLNQKMADFDVNSEEFSL
ncbi:TIMM29 [Branchiostoma lanceolatum]|uniref:TIMM29 protein n=1 Tax=Branchiostoma lanceolatum TaxID=7740 RepID=A0A8K0E6U5_BRALA|nr:TIMM29 [Branchiostoma lanceolatum]